MSAHEQGLDIAKLICFLIGPQVPGAWFTFKEIRPLRYTLRCVLAFAPAGIFFLLSLWHFADDVEAIRASGQRPCGAFGMVSVFTTFAGALVHLGFGSGLQLIHASLVSRSRRGGGGPSGSPSGPG